MVIQTADVPKKGAEVVPSKYLAFFFSGLLITTIYDLRYT